MTIHHRTVDVLAAAKLWNADRSAGDIAKIFGVTRSVIIGIAHRNRELFPRKEQITTRNPKTPTRSPKPKKSLPEEPTGGEATDIRPTDYDEARNVLAKGLLEIQQEDCRFPLGNGRPFMFCAAQVRDGSAYCSHHHFRAYNPRGKS